MTATTEYPYLEPAPKPGWINCFYRYYKGKRLGPYYVRRWKVNGKLHREYIKPDQLEQAKAECQAHRERQQRKREGERQGWNALHNWVFLGRMLTRLDAGKEITRDQAAYILRIEREGILITGRPWCRRRIKRHVALVNGERLIVTTIFELDGTTKTFMAPMKINREKIMADLFRNPFEEFKQWFLGLKDRAKEQQRPQERPPNVWLQQAFESRSLITDY